MPKDFPSYRSSRLQMSFKIGVLKNFAFIHRKKPVLCWNLFLIKLLTPTQVLFCEYCEILKTNFFYRTPTVAASDLITCSKSAKKNNNFKVSPKDDKIFVLGKVSS